ncbi:isopentenyldiphosphate isomerase [Dysgonomonas hofstadii]|uniref:Isopentenyldiphosphate isomerase n=1 Tax=Dysgonomonas hofstadii TaxID=637886 RepID=A0A840CRZ5_9BACT|nr:NUDIX domain-containing protein [Dysgonomonas hofstadii]MBB4037439.1 isopentenyldiphosphate isomerase [Dysgonomonas hofstadii]
MQEEIFPLVDEDGNITGQAPRSVCHNGSKLLHPVIHLHIFNSKGQLFLQKRSPLKDVQPNRWDSSVAGHIDMNESAVEAALREASEELGLSDIRPHFITKYIIETDNERELSYCFYTIYNGDFELNKEELSDGRFWKLSEIEASLAKDIFTTNFELDFNNFLYKGLNGLENNINRQE